jgi:hypothetical protein
MHLERLLALMLSVLLAAFSTTQHAGPSNTEDLSRFVLVIRELPDGQLTHTWQNAEGFDLLPYRSSLGSYNAPAGVMLASSQQRDCHEEYLACSWFRLEPVSLFSRPQCSWLPQPRPEGSLEHA